MSSAIAVSVAIGLLAAFALASGLLLRSREGAPVPTYRYYLAAALAVAVPFGAAAYYYQTREPPVAAGAGAGPHSGEDLTKGADTLAVELESRPGDVDGWVLLARTYGQLERYPEARGALAKALALKPDDTGLHAQLGEILVLEADGIVTPAADVEFARSGADPRARYYRALGLAQQGDTAKARSEMQSLLDDSAADAPWRQGVIDALGELGAAPVAPSVAVPGPSAADMAVAAGMSPEDRQAMIQGMVDKLAARLREHPEDAAGWEKLAHAYEVLGEPDKAAAARARTQPAPGDGLQAEITQLTRHLDAAPADAQGWLTLARDDRLLGRDDAARAALKRATTQIHGNRDLLIAYADLLTAGLQNEALPPDLITVMGQINTLDPDQTDALWYLGLAAAQHGDRHRATIYWTRLIGLLPADSVERPAVKRRLDALP
jgi:cytochrome c-type biogenesis protein CcmH